MARVAIAVAVLACLGLLTASGGSARSTQEVKLFGTVGPEFTISLYDAGGYPVKSLDPGSYEIQVKDLSDFHNFHLQGPGVNETTGIEFTGEATWTVTFTDGSYTFLCDAHPSSMRGAFTVGNTSSTPPPSTSPTPPAAGPVTPGTKLVLTTGPAQVITLKTSAGKTVKTMKLGTYTVTVRDRGRIHNAHVVAPGFNRRTSPLTYTGTQTWKVKLTRAGTFRFLCDPHALLGMKGSAKIVR
jgi:plastocyanin